MNHTYRTHHSQLIWACGILNSQASDSQVIDDGLAHTLWFESTSRPLTGRLDSDVRHEDQESALCSQLPSWYVSHALLIIPSTVCSSRMPPVQHQCLISWDALPTSTTKTNDNGKKVKMSKQSFWRYVDSELQRVRRVSQAVGKTDKDHQDAQTL